MKSKTLKTFVMLSYIVGVVAILGSASSKNTQMTPKSVAPTGDCSDIELMGIYQTGAVYDLRHFYAKIRNNGSKAKVVTIEYKCPVSRAKTVRSAIDVRAGDIAETSKLCTSERPPEVRIISCE